MRKNTLGIPALATALALSSCTNVPREEAASLQDTSPDQANLCEVSDWRGDVVASTCRAGQKVVYLPPRWGNAQLPILFAAVNCDLRYTVALTEGAVTCIYAPITIKPEAPKSKEENEDASTG
jgi:starvation-inducible outer membrane lipoprotein